MLVLHREVGEFLGVLLHVVELLGLSWNQVADILVSSLTVSILFLFIGVIKVVSTVIVYHNFFRNLLLTSAFPYSVEVLNLELF